MKNVALSGLSLLTISNSSSDVFAPASTTSSVALTQNITDTSTTTSSIKNETDTETDISDKFLYKTQNTPTAKPKGQDSGVDPFDANSSLVTVVGIALVSATCSTCADIILQSRRITAPRTITPITTTDTQVDNQEQSVVINQEPSVNIAVEIHQKQSEMPRPTALSMTGKPLAPGYEYRPLVGTR